MSYFEKVSEERRQLGDRVVALSKYLAGSNPSALAQDELDLLTIQRSTMLTYLGILDMRLVKMMAKESK